ncbi:MAG TPA: pantoate--beta-alanine ligase [Candidatus Avamphibacillus sp.]|nr:pantoate--beta-alanine ligase [Candidatus Avamphibacillus sp.]
MKVIHKVKDMQQIAEEVIQQKKKIGFVATMGFFHEGHLSLMREARKENDIVITSIFVNPLQFGENEDYDTYPKDLSKDTSEAEKAGVDILFVPDVKEMYPDEMLVQLHIEERANVLCGRSRHGHFDGVITVLTKLFHIVRPHKAYFGLKDAQQFAVVDALIQNFNFPMELVGLQTIREEDGLAKSSRNVFLSEKERQEAVWLYKGLKRGQQLIEEGEMNPKTVVTEVKNVIGNHTEGKIDYIEILSFPTLKPVSLIDQQVIIATAVYYKEARLIDNLIVNKQGEAIQKFIPGKTGRR